MERFNFFRGKRGIVSEYLPWLLIAIAILVILTIGIVVMKEKGVSVLDKLQGLIRSR